MMIGGTVDGAFRTLVTAGWANESDGDVEAPCGHFALIDMTSERAMMTDVLAESDESELMADIEPAWYVVVTDSQGFVTSNQYGSESLAREAYAWRVEEYSAWLGTDEEE